MPPIISPHLALTIQYSFQPTVPLETNKATVRRKVLKYYNIRHLQKMIQKMSISLSCIAIFTKVVDAGVSSFYDLQTIISPSPLDVLDNLDDYDKFWIDVHQKSCGAFVYLLVVYCNSKVIT